MTKLLENIYRAVNIALVNEMKMLCERMGIDIWEVIEAAKTKPFGFHTRFIELAEEINTYMPYYVTQISLLIHEEYLKKRMKRW